MILTALASVTNTTLACGRPQSRSVPRAGALTLRDRYLLQSPRKPRHILAQYGTIGLANVRFLSQLFEQQLLVNPL